MKATYGDLIRQLGTDIDLTLTQLASKLDLESANLRKSENGSLEFDQKRLNNLVRAFKFYIDNLKFE